MPRPAQAVSAKPARIVCPASAKVALLTVVFLGAVFFCNRARAAEAPQTPLRLDFSGDAVGTAPKGWDFNGKSGTPPATLTVVKDPDTGKNILRLESKKASGTLINKSLAGKINLNKTPLVRWRWKAALLPAGADGRDPKRDDQAIGIYFGYGMILRNTLGFRWETDTPIGSKGKATYGAGMVKVKWEALRNNSSPLNEWIVEERNLAKDFRSSFREVPRKFAASVSINTQYTSTEGAAFLDYIEFLPSPIATGTSPKDH